MMTGNDAGTDLLLAFEAARKKADALFDRLQRVGRASDRLLDCLNEFAPEYPQACAEYCQALDTVLHAASLAGEYDRESIP